MAAKKTRKRKTSSAKKRTRTRQKDFAPFYKEIAVLVVFALFIFLFLSNFGICGYIGNSISTFFFGAFGTTHYIIPAVSFILAILLISNDYSSLAVKKTCFAILLLCMVSTIFQMIYNIEVRDAYSQEISSMHSTVLVQIFLLVLCLFLLERSDHQNPSVSVFVLFSLLVP